jgi:hypothetical protein
MEKEQLGMEKKHPEILDEKATTGSHSGRGCRLQTKGS